MAGYLFSILGSLPKTESRAFPMKIPCEFQSSYGQLSSFIIIKPTTVVLRRFDVVVDALVSINEINLRCMGLVSTGMGDRVRGSTCRTPMLI